MSLKPPVKDDFVRAVGHHQTERTGPREVIRQDELYGTRKLITLIRGGPHGWTCEADVFAELDGRGYLRSDLVHSVNAMCLSCSESQLFRASNKTITFDLNPEPCVRLGSGPAPSTAYVVGRMSVAERVKCSHCGYVFRITDGVCHGA